MWGRTCPWFSETSSRFLWSSARSSSRSRSQPAPKTAACHAPRPFAASMSASITSATSCWSSTKTTWSKSTPRPARATTCRALAFRRWPTSPCAVPSQSSARSASPPRSGGRSSAAQAASNASDSATSRKGRSATSSSSGATSAVVRCRNRGTKMATLVYRYGLLAPTLEADEVAAQMRAAHRYRNTLVEIERGRRTAIRTAEQDDPALTGVQAAAEYIDAELEQLARAAKARRADGRTRKLANEEREALREQRARAKQIRMAIRLYRAFVVIPGLQTERDRINTLAADLRRNARQHRPWGLRHKLVHGTYSLVESADEASRGKLPLYEDPQFRRWGVEGSVGVQIQGGLRAAALLACGDTRAQVSLGGSAPPCNVGRGTHKACVPGECSKPSTGTPTVSGRCGRGAREAAVLRLRVGSTDDRAPVWAEWPM